MPSDRPFALHISWTCYATWLPGDARGYVSNTLVSKGGFEQKQNVPGTPCTINDPYTRQHARRLQKGEAVYLTSELALIVAQALIDAAKQRGWLIVQAAIMANHVHVVIQGCPDDGPAVRRILRGAAKMP